MKLNRYKREEDSDILGVYSGTDEHGRESLFVKLKNKPDIYFESNLLLSKATLRGDKRWAFQVSLTNNDYLGVFRVLIRDLVMVVSNESNQLVAERKLVRRYSEWQKLFEQAKDVKLTDQQILGLIGELYFLNYQVISNLNIEEGIESWIGPKSANHDFQLQNTWLEVKTKSYNKESVIISNKNQLKSVQPGYLIVISAEKTNSLNENAINLFMLYQLILDQILNKEIEYKFLEKLAKIHFIPSDIYKEYSYEIKKIQYYLINDSFPTVDLPLDGTIINLKYELNLPKLNKFEVGGVEWTNIEKSL